MSDAGNCVECELLWRAYAKARHEFVTRRQAAFMPPSVEDAVRAANLKALQTVEAHREEARLQLLRHMQRAHKATTTVV